MASAEKLRVIQDNGRSRLSRCLEQVSRGQFSGRLYFEISFHYRVLAVCGILLEADADAFARLLAKSAQTRLAYLDRLRDDREPDDLYLCVSEDLAFENALAAGEIRAAGRIAGLSPDRRFPEVEYEDDFLYYYFLRMFLLQSTGQARESAGSVLDRLEKTLEGQPAPRLALGRALCDKNAGDFAAALTILASERARKVGKLKKTFGVSKELLATDGALFIEGLALLRLAETAGLRVDGEFRFMPELARVPSRAQELPAGSWSRPDDGP